MTESNASLEIAVAELLAVTGQLLRRLRAVSNTRELTWSQVAIMSRLDDAGALTTADLARAESVKPQSMGAALAVLEQEGLVERRAHPSDGRQVLFTLSEQGRETRRQVGLAKHEWLTAAMETLNADERRTLIEAIGLIRRLCDR